MTWNNISHDFADVNDYPYVNDYLFPLLPKSGKVFILNYTFTFRNHVTNRDYVEETIRKKKKDGE